MQDTDELVEDGFPPIDEERDDDEDDGFLLLVELAEDGFPPIDEERDDDERMTVSCYWLSW